MAVTKVKVKCPISFYEGEVLVAYKIGDLIETSKFEPKHLESLKKNGFLVDEKVAVATKPPATDSSSGQV